MAEAPSSDIFGQLTAILKTKTSVPSQKEIGVYLLLIGLVNAVMSVSAVIIYSIGIWEKNLLEEGEEETIEKLGNGSRGGPKSAKTLMTLNLLIALFHLTSSVFLLGTLIRESLPCGYWGRDILLVTGAIFYVGLLVELIVWFSDPTFDQELHKPNYVPQAAFACILEVTLILLLVMLMDPVAIGLYSTGVWEIQHYDSKNPKANEINGMATRGGPDGAWGLLVFNLLLAVVHLIACIFFLVTIAHVSRQYLASNPLGLHFCGRNILLALTIAYFISTITEVALWTSYEDYQFQQHKASVVPPLVYSCISLTTICFLTLHCLLTCLKQTRNTDPDPMDGRIWDRWWFVG
ncbi:unnamed protein product [Cyprideis torosa]|uniref:Uncharacterized protein n=1 Tax=Cyprideis torosa TaxID=163714 RepID=A0A7R8WLN7_9CRUS|nr:unnamed protein product [Cyprideis torosa]CAG0898290.1 unnamed protein product [Cyprideis torosa]